ncbi:uncharacterized protein LOC143884905 [Tasmannia lanceolata]|uniref:uncharacterized protein LOC143884905 n=1 Tax=Tasmannia lanceolata TaxID=3420 RepID=UPI004062B404
MPPRSAKKGAATPGAKKTPTRAVKTTPKSQKQTELKDDSTPKLQNQTELKDYSVKIEEVSVTVVEIKEEVKVEEVIEEKKAEKPSEQEPVPEVKSEANGALPIKEEEVAKEDAVEDDKDERLELEDNEPEYEPGEDTGVDYDEKELDHDDGQGEGDEGEEEVVEGAVGEEEEGDMGDEEMEDVGGEGEEDAENGEGGHEDIVEEEEHEHHEVVKERRKRKEFEVFVGGLDKDASEEDLKKVFSQVGDVVQVRLMMNPLTKKNKGFAFLRFASVEQAKRAVTELKNPVVNGKQCGVIPSQDSDTLFLGNICKTWTKEALKEKLKQYGVTNVEDLTLVEDSNNEGMNRGFAFLDFSSRSEAMDAYKRLQKSNVVFGVDRMAKVSFADSFIEPDDEIMAQVKTVFVDGLSSSWDEDRVEEHLKKFGKIEKIELARNMPAAKRKDFGFVTFDSHDEALACAEGINNAELGEGDSKVKVRARLSRPHQQGRGKHGVRGDHRIGRGGASRGGRGSSWGHTTSFRSFPGRSPRVIRGRGPPLSGRGFKRPLGFRDKHPVMAVPERARPLRPPQRSYDRRPPISPYLKGSSKRDFGRLEELPPRSRADYGSRVARTSYKDNYPSRGSSYPTTDTAPRGAPRTAARAPYAEEGYDRRFERPPPSYREAHGRDYDSVPGSKRPYSSLDDIPPRYSDAGVRQSRARLDYETSASAPQYGDAYADRLGRSHLGGYGTSKSSLSGQESYGLYGSRHGTGYGGSVSSSDVGGMYSSSYGRDYLSREPDGGSGSYSSLYTGRSLSGGGYLGSGASGSYY